jgi:long-subunit acyl-CoA synthetase (AMP-forming)
MGSSVTIVPFFDSLGPSALIFVLNQTLVTTMVIEKASIDHLLKAKEQCPHLKNIVCFDELPADKKQKAESMGLRVLTYKEV